MRILVFTPVWKRPEILEAYCLGLQRLGLEAFCILSPEDDTYTQKLLDKYGIEYTWFKNKLGAKKNHGLNEVMKKDFDYLLEMNSDDIIKDELMGVYQNLMEQGEDFIGLGNFAFYNSKTGESKQRKGNTLFGIGRAYRKEALAYGALVVNVLANKTETTRKNHFKAGLKYVIHPSEVTLNMDILSEPYYRLWDDHADYGMDNHSEEVLARRGILPSIVKTPEPWAFDIKSNVNIWSWDQMTGCESYDTKKLFRGLSEAEKTHLDEIHTHFRCCD